MPKIVIIDLPKNALVHSVLIKKWLTEYRDAIEAGEFWPGGVSHPAVRRKVANMQAVIDTIDDKPTDDPF